jgi:hypothetical protein
MLFDDKLVKQRIADNVAKIKLPLLIGLCGPSGAGKDTAAGLLTVILADSDTNSRLYDMGWFKWCAKQLAFATPLREVVSALLGNVLPVSASTIEVACASQIHKNTPMQYGPTYKEFQQKFGTEFVRNMVHPDFWILAMSQRLSYYKSHQPAIITDVRFQNEVDFVQSCGGLIIRISRDVPAVGIPGHMSDKVFDLDLTKGAYREVENTSTIEDFDLALEAALESYAQELIAAKKTAKS